MRRLWWGVAVVLWLMPSMVWACPGFEGELHDRKGNVLAGVSVTVVKTGTSTPVPLYDGPDCTSTKTNPFESDSDGRALFFVAEGTYDVTYTRDGGSFPLYTSIPLFDPCGVNCSYIGKYQTTDLTAVGLGALDVIGASVHTLIINQAATAQVNDTCPSTVTLLFQGNGTLTLSSGKTLTMNCRVINLTDHSVLIGAGTYSYSQTSVIKGHQWFAANTLTADGTQCANPARVTINSGPAIHTIVCADNDGSSIYGHWQLPSDYLANSAIEFVLLQVQTAADTNAMQSDLTAQCRTAGGSAIDATWATEVSMDHSMSGSAKFDSTTVSLVPNGTCTAGGILFWRWQLDAAGTTTAVATLHTLGFELRYFRNPNTPMVN